MNEILRTTLITIFGTRPCMICHRLGWCGHREPLVELAFLHAQEAADARNH